MGRDRQFDPGAGRCLANHLEHSERPQSSAVALLAGAEDRIAGLSLGIPFTSFYSRINDICWVA